MGVLSCVPMSQLIIEIKALHKRGAYGEVLARTVDLAVPELPGEAICEVVGALAFLGRLQEAQLLCDSRAAALDRHHMIRCRFFLSIGLCRVSSYAEAQRLLLANLAERRENKDTVAGFYIFQGLAFYRYFSGRLDAALRAGERAFACAFKCDYLYGRVLATDLIGHAAVRSGRITYGLKQLGEAARLSLTLGDGGISRALQVSMAVYEAQFGLNPHDTVGRLRDLADAAKNDDIYSRSTALLELGAQHMLRGSLRRARLVLDEACQQIYGVRNRRYESQLNVRYAQLLFLEGEPLQALHFVRNAWNQLVPHVDRLLQLEVLRHEVKLLEALGMSDAARDRLSALRELCRKVGDGVSARMLARRFREADGAMRDSFVSFGEDRLGDLLDAVARAPNACVDDILACGYYGLLRAVVDVPASGRMVYLGLKPGCMVTFDHGSIRFVDGGASPNIVKLCAVLAQGPQTKAALIGAVWGYDYHPARHDGLIYSTVANLRRLLGDLGSWLEFDGEFYQLAAGVHIKVQTRTRREPVATPIKLSPKLNHRQEQALEFLESHEFIDTKTYCHLHGVSDMTATRDLGGLTRKGFVVKVGSARLTRYRRLPSDSNSINEGGL